MELPFWWREATPEEMVNAVQRKSRIKAIVMTILLISFNYSFVPRFPNYLLTTCRKPSTVLGCNDG